MYFDQLSGADRTWKLVKTLFWPFFNDFHPITYKMFEKQCFSWSTPWVGTLNLSFWVICFWVKNHHKYKKSNKKLNMAKKRVSTSFQVLTAAESWSKYITMEIRSCQSWLKSSQEPFILHYTYSLLKILEWWTQIVQDL